MKKVFAILAVVAFVACNSGENKEAAADTTAVVDTTAVAVDTTAVDTTAAAVDTTKAAH
ncbi:MAG: hypothetical protein RJA53_1032 [Bacteroidota bacterium]|jgi:uncharacterized protein YcfL